MGKEKHIMLNRIASIMRISAQGFMGLFTYAYSYYYFYFSRFSRLSAGCA